MFLYKEMKEKLDSMVRYLLRKHTSLFCEHGVVSQNGHSPRIAAEMPFPARRFLFRSRATFSARIRFSLVRDRRAGWCVSCGSHKVCFFFFFFSRTNPQYLFSPYNECFYLYIYIFIYFWKRKKIKIPSLLLFASS